MQLCAQGLCLEEMIGTPLPQGALFYAETKRRLVVPFDADPRALTEKAAVDLARVLACCETPAALSPAEISAA